MSDANNTKARIAAVNDLHATTFQALARIRGAARCALRALESPKGARDLESIAQVLAGIADLAEFTYCEVDWLGDVLGISHCKESWKRRQKAKKAARETPKPEPV